jgi:cyclomaltodextrinase
MIAVGTYRHFKGKNYKVIMIAKHSETLEDYVVYQALYGEKGIWVRPLNMFEETIEIDGNIVKRFEYIGE